MDGGPALFAFPGFGFALLYACLIHICTLYWLCVSCPGDLFWFRPTIGNWSLGEILRAVNLLAIGYLLTYIPQLSYTKARKKTCCWCFLVASVALVVAIDLYVVRAGWLSVQPFVGMDSAAGRP